MLSPVATSRKVEEKCKTFPIKKLEFIYELSSEAHGSDIQAFLSIQNVLYFKNSRVAVRKRSILLHMAPEHHMAMSLPSFSILISDLSTMVYHYIDLWTISLKASWQAAR